MLRKKDQIFRLIEVLKAPEKAYFKKYAYKDATQEREAIALFQLIDKQLKKGSIEEEQLITKFQSKFPKSNYTKQKSRLYQLLLEIVAKYDKSKNELHKIFDLVAYADSLGQRKLFFDAKNVLEKAAKIAEELEQIELLVFIKVKLHFYELYIKKYGDKKSINNGFNELPKLLHTLNRRVDDLTAVHDVLQFQKTIGVPRSKEDLERLKTIQSHPSFQLDYEAELFSSKIELSTALCGIYFALGDVKMVIKISQKFFKEFQPSEKLTKLYTSKFLSLYDSFLQACLLSLQLPLFEEYYSTFIATKTYGEDQHNFKKSLNLYLQSIYAIVSKQPSLIEDLVQAFEEIKDESYIPNYRKISLAYYMLFGSFLAEDYTTCNNMILWFREHKQLGIRHDIEIAVWTMECIILIQSEDSDLLDYKLRAFYEFLKNKDRKFLMETALMQLLKRLNNSINSKEMKKVLKDSYDEMQRIVKEHPHEKTFLNGFDIISWLESELNDQSFSSVYYKNNIDRA